MIISSVHKASPPFIHAEDSAYPYPAPLHGETKPPPEQPGDGNKQHPRAKRAGPLWLSFSTARRKDFLHPSHFEWSLNPAPPGLPLGVSRRFGTMACVTRSRLA